MYPDISQAIMTARVAERHREAELWRVAREARLAARHGADDEHNSGQGGRRGIARMLGTPRAARAH
jgi:hypothetical protein